MWIYRYVEYLLIYLSLKIDDTKEKETKYGYL